MSDNHNVRCMGCDITDKVIGVSNLYHIGSSVAGTCIQAMTAIPNPGDSYPALAVILVDNSVLLIYSERDAPNELKSVLHEITAKMAHLNAKNVNKSTAREVYFKIFSRIADLVDEGSLYKKNGRWFAKTTELPKEMLQ